ncbi:carbonic anhydrase [Xylogone sp. PMI_703]|nr:carbonic anhydrase [Xylogone sp. PMI_703]
MASFTFRTEKTNFADLLQRAEEYAKSSSPLPYVSEAPKDFVAPTVAIFSCCDFRFYPEEYFQLKKGEAFVFRTVGGNLKPYLQDLLFLETLLNSKLEEIIVIHHEDCGTTRITPSMIKEHTKRAAPERAAEIDHLDFQMHNGKNLEESVRNDLKFLRESPYIRKELGLNAKGYVFYMKTNKLVQVK